MVRQQACLQTKWLALPHGLLPTQNGHKLGSRTPPSTTVTCREGNLSLFGDSEDRKAEENWRRLENPQNYGEANTALNTEQGALNAECASLSGVTPEALSPGRRQNTPSSSASFVLKSNFFWRISFFSLSFPNQEWHHGHFSHIELARYTHIWAGLPSHTGSFLTI